MTALLVLLFAMPSCAEAAGFRMLIVDDDPKGTSLRERPNGPVVSVIPHGGATDAEREKREVTVTGQDKDWFSVRLDDGTVGWLPGSVLGSCSSATEDGDCRLYAKPQDGSATVIHLEYGTPLELLEIQGRWAKMRFSSASGKSLEGWTRESCLFSNALNDCRDPKSLINISKRRTIRNALPVGIASVFCLEGDGARKRIAGELAPGASLELANKDIPECRYLEARLSDGRVWRFIHEPAISTEVVFSMEIVAPGVEKQYPFMTVALGSDQFLAPAGVPLTDVQALMAKGMDEAGWKALTLPHGDTPTDPGSFVVSFWDTSWSLTKEGIAYAQAAPGKRLASSVTLEGTFGERSIQGVLDYAKTHGYVPALFVLNDRGTAFSKVGETLAPGAELVAGANSPNARWEALDATLEKVKDGKGDLARLVFETPVLLFDLRLNMDAAHAVLRLARKEGAPFQ